MLLMPARCRSVWCLMLLLVVLGEPSSRASAAAQERLSLAGQWRFQADGFFSKTRGSVQRLANGNTLITESNSGYVFEVTPRHEVVWRFANPEIGDEGNRSAMFRMSAHDRDATPFLKSLSRPGPDARTAGLPNEG